MTWRSVCARSLASTKTGSNDCSVTRCTALPTGQPGRLYQPSGPAADGSGGRGEPNPDGGWMVGTPVRNFRYLRPRDVPRRTSVQRTESSLKPRCCTGLAVLALLAIAGCGGGSPRSGQEPSATNAATSATSAPAPTTSRTATATHRRAAQTKRQRTRKSQPHHSPTSAAYRDSRDICETFGWHQVASEYGGRDEVSAADAYAKKTYIATKQQDAFEGCLAGFGVKR